MSPQLCIPLATCFENSDCGKNVHGKKGRCSGLFVGTCNCDVCYTGARCKSDADCGNLQNACNVEKGYCYCIKGMSIKFFYIFII